MTVVVDTNVVVSGIFFGGQPLEILRACVQGRCRLLISQEILDEYRDVTTRMPHRHSALNVATVLAALVENAQAVIAPPLDPPICRDSADDKFIACALAGSADYIVTGDKDLLVLAGRVSVPILSPRQFLARIIHEVS